MMRSPLPLSQPQMSPYVAGHNAWGSQPWRAISLSIVIAPFWKAKPLRKKGEAIVPHISNICFINSMNLFIALHAKVSWSIEQVPRGTGQRTGNS